MHSTGSIQRYIRFRGKVSGPFSAEELGAMISRGQVTRLHEVSHSGHSWKPISEDQSLSFSNTKPRTNTRHEELQSVVKGNGRPIDVLIDEKDSIAATLPVTPIRSDSAPISGSIATPAIPVSSGDDAEQLAEVCDATTITQNTTAPPPPASPAPSPNRLAIDAESSFSRQRTVLAITAAAGMLATFLPWVKAPIIGSIDGTAGDGWITLALFACALALCFTGNRSRSISGVNHVAIAIPSLLAGLIGLWKVLAFRERMAEMRSEDNAFAAAMSLTVQIGIGIYLLIIAAAAMIILPFLLRDQKAG